MSRPVAILLLAAGDGSSPTSTIPDADFSAGSVGGALLLALVAAIPLGLSLWALLDAARRPRWAWALTGRRQVLWMTFILVGILSVFAGIAISAWYLIRVRPQVADAEDGYF